MEGESAREGLSPNSSRPNPTPEIKFADSETIEKCRFTAFHKSKKEVL
jgi:hypothetical protein